jgi:hypothetical protein
MKIINSQVISASLQMCFLSKKSNLVGARQERDGSIPQIPGMVDLK